MSAMKNQRNIVYMLYACVYEKRGDAERMMREGEVKEKESELLNLVSTQ
jgi:flagellin-specific chaperone FliS